MEDAEPRTEDSDRKRGHSDDDERKSLQKTALWGTPWRGKVPLAFTRTVVRMWDEYFTKYVDERDLKEAVKQENPVPENFQSHAYTLIIMKF